MTMKLWMGLALAATMAASPAFAASKTEKSMSATSMKKSDVSQQDQSREPGPDGTFQGMPVVQGPANWTKGSSASNTGSTGLSKSKTSTE